jgi:hypothetical protein
MLHNYLDFIRQSALFQKKYIQNNYKNLSEREFQSELAAYRNFCLKEATRDKQSTTKKLSKGLSVFPEYFSNAGIPDEAFLKHSCLYLDEIVIDDPLFRHTKRQSSQSEAFNTYMGLPSSKKNSERANIASAGFRILQLKPAIKTGFVKILPVSFLHEQPDEVPISILSAYRNALPTDILQWFKQQAKILPVKELNSRWIVLENEPLIPTNSISIRFGDLDLSFFEFYMEIDKLLETDKTGVFKFLMKKRTNPPEEVEFSTWVNDVVSKYSIETASEIIKEFELAEDLGSLFLTRTTFVDEFINKVGLRSDSSGSKKRQEEIFPLTLKLDLPIVDHVTLDQILHLKEKEGEVFLNFRTELEKQLRDLRAEKDPEKLKLQIDKVSHELHEVQINEINKKIAKVKNDIHIDTGIIFAGAFISFFSGGVSIPIIGTAAVAGLGKGYKDVSQQNREVKLNPAFFLWKLKTKVK